MIDLHTHTNISDGTLSPRNLMLYCKRKGIDVLAIADHETIDHYDEYKSTADSLGIKLIPAIELNVGGIAPKKGCPEGLLPFTKMKNFHLIGHGIQDRAKVESYFQEIRESNIDVCRQVLVKLQEVYDISFGATLEEAIENVRAYNHDGVLDKKAIAKALIAEGYAPDTRRAYDFYIGTKAKAYVPIRKVTAKDVIDVIHEAGGVVSCAHPATIRYFDQEDNPVKPTRDDYMRLFAGLKEMGLDGVECFTAVTEWTEEDFFQRVIAKEFDLLVMGGSDFHNHTVGEKLGQPQLTREMVDALEARIAQRQALNAQKQAEEEAAKTTMIVAPPTDIIPYEDPSKLIGTIATSGETGSGAADSETKTKEDNHVQ